MVDRLLPGGMVWLSLRRLLFYVCAFFALSLESASALEVVPSFDARITVRENATIEVAERIVYDFGVEKRRGIFRVIPYSYQAGAETYTADISSVAVHDDRGVPVPYDESRGNGVLTLKIGDPDKIVSGIRTYVISYVVEGPFLYWDDADEFYWNVTGSWPNSIERASVLVDLPKGANVLRATCYQGVPGSSTHCSENKELVNNERAGYTAVANKLAPQNGFTIAVSFPKGTIAEAEQPWKSEPRTILSYTPLCIPAVTLLAMWYLWYTRGRDPRGRETIVTEFTPPEGVQPSVAGIVYNQYLEDWEVSAEIVELAVNGYLKIHRIEDTVLKLFRTTDYLFERLNARIPDDVVSKSVLEALFADRFIETVEVRGVSIRGALLSRMKNSFAKEKASLIKNMYREVVAQGYFLAQPDRVRAGYITAGTVLSILGFLVPHLFGLPFLSSHMVENSALFTALMVVLSGGIVICFGFFMPARTKDGVLLRERLEGFKRYLTVAEKDRLAFHNAPERTPELFSTYLPFAMAFGVERKWAEQFEGVYTGEPSWYSGGAMHSFNAGAFAANLSSFAGDFASASAPRSSGSGGGGSVGGGFGGGGGGSW